MALRSWLRCEHLSTVIRPKPCRCRWLGLASSITRRTSSGAAARRPTRPSPNVQVGGAPAHGSLLTGLDGAAGSRGIESIHVVDRSARSCAEADPESSHHPNHMCPAAAALLSRRPKSSVRSLLRATIFPDLRNRASHVSAHANHAHADCSPLHRSTMAEPSWPVANRALGLRADDNRTAFYALPTARFY
jgi:hypothetical protein